MNEALLGQIDAWSGVDVAGQLGAFAPMIVLICTMLAVVACPIVLNRSPRTVAAVVVVGILAAFYACLRVSGSITDGGISGLSPGTSGILIADHLSVAFQILLIVFLGGVVWMWWMGSADTEENAPEFFILLLGSALGMALMVSTVNLLVIIIAIETASLPSYAIVGFDKRDRLGAEASLKYMVFGAMSAAIMIYGASLLYGLCGSLNMGDVAAYTAANLLGGDNRMLLGLALLCFFAGIAFKISAVPFHFWCPDAFQGAKIEVTTWLSVASKSAGLLLLGRLTVIMCSAVEYEVSMSTLLPIAWVIGGVACITCTLGNFSAYKQTSVKRLLAYSSIAHAGYMMMATAVFLHPDHPSYESGLTALFVYIVIYVFMNLGAFGVTALVIWDCGSDDISKFNGLIRRAPWLAVPMVICLMSLVGLPPLAGFLGKWWILLALVSMGDTSYATLCWVLIIVTMFNTLISLYYYMRIIVQMILRDDGQKPVQSPIGGIVMVNICAVALMLLFVFAQPLKTVAHYATSGLYRASVSITPSSSVALVDGRDSK